MTSVPYIIFLDRRCAEALDFYTNKLGMKLISKMHYKDMNKGPDMIDFGKIEGNEDLIMHAELEFFGATIMLNMDSEKDVDKIAKIIVENGGKSVIPPGNTFWGARFSNVVDKFNITWQLHFQRPE